MASLARARLLVAIALVSIDSPASAKSNHQCNIDLSISHVGNGWQNEVTNMVKAIAANDADGWTEMRDGCNVFDPKTIKSDHVDNIYTSLTPEVGLAAALHGTPEPKPDD